MKGNTLLKKYLFFMLCAAAVVGAAVFYFRSFDRKENTTTIVIESNEKKITTDIPADTTEKITAKTKINPIKETNSTSQTTASAEQTTEYVFLDINSADAEELKKLRGVGDVIAGEIIRYRESNGGFRNIEEIMNVKGIGEVVFSDIREHIYVTAPVYEPEDETNETELIAEETSVVSETEYVPALEDVVPVNINTADENILVLLPHIDDEIASKIISFREQAGGFSNEYELLLIEGLSREKVSEILPYIEIH